MSEDISFHGRKGEDFEAFELRLEMVWNREASNYTDTEKATRNRCLLPMTSCKERAWDVVKQLSSDKKENYESLLTELRKQFGSDSTDSRAERALEKALVLKQRDGETVHNYIKRAYRIHRDMESTYDHVLAKRFLKGLTSEFLRQLAKAHSGLTDKYTFTTAVKAVEFVWEDEFPEKRRRNHSSDSEAESDSDEDDMTREARARKKSLEKRATKFRSRSKSPARQSARDGSRGSLNGEMTKMNAKIENLADMFAKLEVHLANSTSGHVHISDVHAGINVPYNSTQMVPQQQQTGYSGYNGASFPSIGPSQSFGQQQPYNQPEYRANIRGSSRLYGSSSVSCYNCGLQGHVERFCPHPRATLEAREENMRRIEGDRYPYSRRGPSPHRVNPAPGQNGYKSYSNTHQAHASSPNLGAPPQQPPPQQPLPLSGCISDVNVIEVFGEGLAHSSALPGVEVELGGFASVEVDAVETQKRLRRARDGNSSASASGNSRKHQRRRREDGRAIPTTRSAAPGVSGSSRQDKGKERESLPDAPPPPPPGTAAAPIGSSRRQKPVAIKMMEGQDVCYPIALLRNAPVVGMTWGDFLSLSPSVKKELARQLVSRRPRRKHSARAKVAEINSTSAQVPITLTTPLAGRARPEDAAIIQNFFTTAAVRAAVATKLDEKGMVIDAAPKRGTGGQIFNVLLDGGSVLNLMPEKLANYLRLPLFTTTALQIRVASSQVVPIKHMTWVIIEIAGVKSISRVYCLPTMEESSFSLLLGRGWLRQVRALGDYETGAYTIRDEAGNHFAVQRRSLNDPGSKPNTSSAQANGTQIPTIEISDFHAAQAELNDDILSDMPLDENAFRQGVERFYSDFSDLSDSSSDDESSTSADETERWTGVESEEELLAESEDEEYSTTSSEWEGNVARRF